MSEQPKDERWPVLQMFGRCIGDHDCICQSCQSWREAGDLLAHVEKLEAMVDAAEVAIKGAEAQAKRIAELEAENARLRKGVEQAIRMFKNRLAFVALADLEALLADQGPA